MRSAAFSAETVFAALGASPWHGAHAAAKVGLYFAEERIAAEGTAGPGVQTEAVRCGV
jgi:hypothetical protein